MKKVKAVPQNKIKGLKPLYSVLCSKCDGSGIVLSRSQDLQSDFIDCPDCKDGWIAT